MSVLTTSQLLAALLPPEPLSKAAFTGEAAGEFFSAYYTAGRPGAASTPSGGVNGTARSATVSGQIPFPAAVANKSVYLAGFDGAQAGNIGGVWLCDRLWDNSGLVVTTTTEQTFTTPTWPARDLDGATAGRGVELAIEVSTATTNGSAVTNTTFRYTSSTGVGSRTGTITSFPATAVAGTLAIVSYAAGDVGAQSIQGVTLGTSYGAGAIHAVAFRRVAFLPLATDNIGQRLDAFTAGMPKLYDSSVPFLLYVLKGAAGGAFNGSVTWAQG